MKVALCFIISYKHILNKEELWKEWIKENQDIINVYFHYKDIQEIKSPWILRHCLPSEYIYQTSYMHVIPAYLSLMKYASQHDKSNQWFCFLTDSCCPIISPHRFRYLFFENYCKSILSWKKAWWNPSFHKRANLALLPEEFHLANDPWFVLNREHIKACLQYADKKQPAVKTICNGGLANESLFAIMLYGSKKMDQVISHASHAADWSRMASTTSPHLFQNANTQDIQFIEKTLNTTKYTMFIRKIAPEFPDDVLRHYIYSYLKDKDDLLVIRRPFLLLLKILFTRMTVAVFFVYFCSLLYSIYDELVYAF
jgi:hypothetical protein